MSLYKYVVPDRTEVFKNGLMRFSQPEALNDPFEMKPYFETVAPQGHFTRALNSRRAEIMRDALSDETLKKAYSELPAHVRGKLPYDTLILIVRQNAPGLSQLLEQHLNEFIATVPEIETEIMLPIVKQELPAAVNKHIGVLCLTAKPNNRLMWSHYAQNHEGFVLELDDRHPYFHRQRSPNDELNHLRKVVYVADRPCFASLADMTMDALFLTKGKEWEYEEEWRMLCALKEADEIKGDVHLFAVPPACVTGVILGCRMSDVKKKEVAQLLKDNRRYSHVRQYQARMSETEYGIDIVASAL